MTGWEWAGSIAATFVTVLGTWLLRKWKQNTEQAAQQRRDKIDRAERMSQASSDSNNRTEEVDALTEKESQWSAGKEFTKHDL